MPETPPLTATDSTRPTGLAAVRARLAQAASAAGRNPAEVSLIAVSKEQPWDRIAPVLDAGQTVFGENRVQEAEGRWAPVRESGRAVALHLVGPLQTNKARAAVGLFQAIHSLDRPKLATTLARLADETGGCPDLFVQVNVGEEPQKAGCLRADTDALVAEAQGLGLPVKGLMCIPPDGADPSPHFAWLRERAAALGLPWLSMGMSGDLEAAVAHGATHVRVGAAIFGARDPAARRT